MWRVDVAIDLLFLFVGKLTGRDKALSTLELGCNWKKLVKGRAEKVMIAY